jgi:hypothetical protein
MASYHILPLWDVPRRNQSIAILRAPYLTTTSNNQSKPDHVRNRSNPDRKQDAQAQVHTNIILEMKAKNLQQWRGE